MTSSLRWARRALPLRSGAATRGPRRTVWRNGPQVLQVATYAVLSVALGVQALTVAEAGFPLGGWLSLLLVVAGTAAAARSTILALVLTAAATVTAAVLGYVPVGVWSAACFVALILTLRGSSALLVGVVLGAANLIGAGIFAGTIRPTADPAPSIAAAAALVLATVGSAVRANQQYWRELEARTRQAEQTRQAWVERSVAEERLRIARDLHDSVGHQIAVVSMHLGSAEVQLPPEADGARAALGSARRGVQGVLRETQQILRVLRVGSDSTAQEPTPGHGRIGELVQTHRDAGMSITATLPDLTGRWPQDVSTAAFRIVQEALTNAQKHGTGTVSLSISLTEGGTAVIEVVNMRAARPHGAGTAGGHGLVGMRERASAAGGRLETHSEGRLFWVRAELPTNEEDRR